MSEREIDARYRDPADLVWIGAAGRLGIRIARSAEVFASWDGRETLTIGRDEDLDPDDCLAQMVFHELCHALVAGEEAVGQPDWGLANEDDRDLDQEHATLRLQAALADRHGLRGFLASTAQWRPYYDRLPADPLAEPEGPEDERAVALARAGWKRATEGPWAAVLEGALAATEAVAAAVRPFADGDSLWRRATGI